MRPALLLLVLLQVPVEASGPSRVTVDYDHDAEFSRYATYRWLSPVESEVDPLLEQRLASGIEFQLALRGLRRMGAGEPDLWVTYHSDSDGDVVVNSGDLGYHFGPAWFWGGGPVSSASAVHEYPARTLVVDLWEGETGRLVWRGSAEDAVRMPRPRIDTELADLLEAIFASYPPKRYGDD
jgi:hypothetical protein